MMDAHRLARRGRSDVVAAHLPAAEGGDRH